MKLADFFLQLNVKGDTKQLGTTIKQLEEAEKKSNRLIKYINDLKKATSQQEKALIKKNFADKVNIENMKKQENALKRNNSALRGTVKGIGAFIAGVTVAYKVIDRMVDSLSIANQRMISFQRQTGISFASLNKYASASASVNYNATPEQMANTMQTLAQNLFDIRMGRGDISPYQELAFVGGKPFNPFGMNVEQLIESVREAIKGVDDVQATNIISRMGFSPDDLLMLRMSKDELKEIHSLFLTSEEQERLNKYSLQIKKTRMEMSLTGQKILLSIMPVWTKLSKIISSVVLGFERIVTYKDLLCNAIKAIGIAFAGWLVILHPIISAITALYLILEDLAFWNAGKGSVFGDIFGGKGSEKYTNSALGKTTNAIGKAGGFIARAGKAIFAKGSEKAQARQELDNFMTTIHDVPVPPQSTANSNVNSNFNQTNNVTINTSSTGEEVTGTYINNNSEVYKQLIPQGI